LLDGYRYRWLKNVSRHPGLQTFAGCDTPELFDLIRPDNFDALLVLGWNRKSFVQGIRAAWRNKVPVLVRGDSQLGSTRSRLKGALKYLPYRWFLPRIDAHLYVGKRNRDYLVHYDVREKQLFFSPHFVDNEFFATRAQAARDSGRTREIREEFGIPLDAFVALFVGKFIRVKRPDDFVAASLHAANMRPDFHAMLVGDGPMRSEIEALAYSKRSRVHFADFRNQRELPAFYEVANVLVVPGTESWALVVNEAMACGVPAIASDAVGCAPDLIDEGSTGWTFPLNDVASLAQLLISFRAIDRNALRRKCEFYSMEHATEGLQKAVEAITGRER